MFGILCTLSAVTARCLSSIKDITYDYKSKEEAKSNNKLRYYDSNGASRLVSDDRQVYDTTLKNGDRVTKDLNGNIIFNYDYPIRQQWIKDNNDKLLKENVPVRCLGFLYDIYPNYKKDRIIQLIPKKTLVYESIANGNKYVRERTENLHVPKYVYINLKNGDYEFLDECDQEAEKWLIQKNKYKHEQIIIKEF